MPGFIILVEDEPENLTDLSCHLENLGYLVECFSRGHTVLDSVRDGLRYDLAIVDLSLPDIPGKEVIQFLKSHYPQKPVISLSGYGYLDAPGADAKYTKPILSSKRWDEFDATIERYVQQSRAF